MSSLCLSFPSVRLCVCVRVCFCLSVVVCDLLFLCVVVLLGSEGVVCGVVWCGVWVGSGSSVCESTRCDVSS